MAHFSATRNFLRVLVCVLAGLPGGTAHGQKQNQSPPRPSLIWTYYAPNVVRIGSPVKVALDAADNNYVLSNPETSDTEAPHYVQVVKVNPAGSPVYALIFATGDQSHGNAIKADSAGFAYLLWGNYVSKINQTGGGFVFHQLSTGLTESFGLGLDTGSNVYVAGQLNGDAAVAKLDSTGAAVWVRTVGGSAADVARGIALDSAGNIWITGRTTSPNFPVLNAFQSSLAGDTDAFLVKFDASGNRTFSSYLGGIEFDEGLAIVTDRFGNIHVGGDTASEDFPTLNPVQSALRGTSDGFVAEVSSAGSLMYSTFLGGSAYDQIQAIDVNFQTETYVTGITYSTDFPLVRSQQTTLQGNWQAFLTKINRAASGYEYSTYQSGGPNYFYEGQGLVIDSQSNVLVSISYDVYQSGGSGRALLLKFSKK